MRETAGSEATIQVRDLVKHFDEGAVRALNGVSLEVRQGECVAVTGPSGCGKSTLLHLLAALDTPTSGSITVAGEDLAGLRDRAGFRRTRIGLVFQLHNLVPHLTAQQNVEVAMFGTGRSRRERQQRAAELLEAVELADCATRPPTKLSGGERQRVAIARALANDPPVLLADEPTGNLDMAAVTHVIDLLQRLQDQHRGLTVLVVTHDERVAAAADRVVHMQDGCVLEPVSGS
ncbi:MAG: ABC transporter ATP-binding protein [Mycobacteriales bacterium]